jgi:uncharacterized protein (TIGR03000 family)
MHAIASDVPELNRARALARHVHREALVRIVRTLREAEPHQTWSACPDSARGIGLPALRGFFHHLDNERRQEMTSQLARGVAALAALAALAAWVGTGSAVAREWPNGYDPLSGLTWDEDFGDNGGLNPFGVKDFDFRRAAFFPESYANRGMGPNPYFDGAGRRYYSPPLNARQPVPGQNYSYGAYAPARDNEARLHVVVPADAKVWFDDKATQQTGPERYFESPPLTPGKEYSYDIKVQWRDRNGKEVTRTRHVDVRANSAVNVDFARQ